jgi:hypothetical protein
MMSQSWYINRIYYGERKGYSRAQVRAGVFMDISTLGWEDGFSLARHFKGFLR